MLLELFQWLAKDFRAFGVFQYITLRTVLAALTALAISFIIGPWMIKKLTHLKIGQSVYYVETVQNVSSGVTSVTGTSRPLRRTTSRSCAKYMPGSWMRSRAM